MHPLSTLYRLRARLNLAASETADDARLLHILNAASAQIERAAGRRFSPRRAALQHTVTASAELLLDDDLLQLLSLTNGDGSTIPLNDVIAAPDEPPHSLLYLTGNSRFTWDAFPLQAITVTGIWGYHDHPSEMWRNSADTVQNNPLSDSAASLTVTDADGADSALETPRFQVGHLLKIEDEFLRVLAVNTATNSLTVSRGRGGTTAASHAQNTPIYAYQPPAEIESPALRWASWLYKQPDTAAFQSLPADFIAALAPFHRLTVKI